MCGSSGATLPCGLLHRWGKLCLLLLMAHLGLHVLVSLSELVTQGKNFGLEQGIFILYDHELVVLLAQTFAHLLHLSFQLLLHVGLEFNPLLEQVDVVFNLLVLVNSHFEVGLQSLKFPAKFRVLMAEILVFLSQLLH